MSTRTFKHSIDIKASADSVWKAITEGEEIIKWFAPIARVKPGLGGEYFISWGGGMEGTAPIRIWEPGKRFGWVEREDTESPRVVEFTLEAKDGGITTLRLTQSGFNAAAKFDDEFEATGGGWKTFFEMLKYSQERWPNTPARNVFTLQMIPLPQAEATERLIGALKLSSTSVGSRYTGQLGGHELRGVVLANPKLGYVLLKVESVDDSMLGLFVEKCGGTGMITVEWVVFGDTCAREPEFKSAIDELLASTFELKKETEAGVSAG